MVNEFPKGLPEVTPNAIINKVKELAPDEIDTILEEARKITDGSRNVEYGGAKESFRRIAGLAHDLGVNSITSIDVIRVLIAVKLVRESNNHKRDNLVDLCGYARLLSIVEGDEEPLAKN